MNARSSSWTNVLVRLFVLGATSGVLLFYGSRAGATDAAGAASETTAAGTSAETTELETVIVTARKRD